VTVDRYRCMSGELIGMCPGMIININGYFCNVAINYLNIKTYSALA
jgi:hypothetical protein